MNQSFRSRTLALVDAWFAMTERHAVAVVVATALLTAVGAWYSATHLSLNTSTKEMLSRELPWRQLDIDYEQTFPQHKDNILVVIEAATPDQALDGADRLYQGLLRERDVFPGVYYANKLSVFRESALLFLDLDELQDLADSLAAVQPFLGRLTAQQNLQGLFSMLGEAIDAIEDGEDIDLSPLLSQINAVFVSLDDDIPRRVSWHQLMAGEDTVKNAYREFILVQPHLDRAAALPGEAGLDRLRALAVELGIESELGATMHLTGNVALEYEELQSVVRSSTMATVLALFIVTTILVLGMRSLRLTLATFLALPVGLVLTATFAAVAVGQLNLISIAFGVLYIGLGTDYAIHYCLRYREYLAHGERNDAAIRHTSRHTGSALFLCAATAGIGFWAFIPTDYHGVAELGLISGGGILISLLVTFTFIPALLTLWPEKRVRPAAQRGSTGLRSSILNVPFNHARLIRLSAAMLGVLLLTQIGRIEFDYNTMNLKDQDAPSVRTFQSLLADSTTSPWIGVLIADDRGQARQRMEALERLDVVDKTVWLEDFVPADQDDKLIIIDEMSLLLGDLPESNEVMPVSVAQAVETLKTFRDQLQRSTQAQRDRELKALARNIDTLLRSWEQEPAVVAAQAARLNDALVASLPGRLDTLRASLNASEITLDNLPRDLVGRWRNNAGRHLIEIYPRENINDNDAMRRFVRGMQRVDARVIGAPVVNVEAGNVVVRAFIQAFVYALVVITLLLFALLRSAIDVLHILVTLLLGALLTAGIGLVFGVPLNFANIIALPLLLGIGVDNSILILHRYRHAEAAGENPLHTSSARAVVVSALTNIGGIGNLAFSPHAGTASMGLLLSVGIVMTLLCSLIVLPSLLVLHRRGQES